MAHELESCHGEEIKKHKHFLRNSSVTQSETQKLSHRRSAFMGICNTVGKKQELTPVVIFVDHMPGEDVQGWNVKRGGMDKTARRSRGDQ